MANANQKRIVTSNLQVLDNLFKSGLYVNIFYIIIWLIFYRSSFGFFSFLPICFFNAVYYTCYSLLKSHAEPIITEDTFMVEDLKKSTGNLAEYLFDVYYVTLFVQVSTLLSNYFWLVWLVIPGYAGIKIGLLAWSYFVASKQNPMEQYGNYDPTQGMTKEELKRFEKKQKKQERQEKLMGIHK
eukprot:gene11621-4863_t